MKGRTGILYVALAASALMIFQFGCVDKTIRTGSVVEPAATPPLRVEANIKLDDFQKLCNFVPEEGDQRTESGSDEIGKTVKITLGTGKRRQNPSAVRMGCTPGKTFIFTGPETRLAP